jgi:biotin carboxylase
VDQLERLVRAKEIDGIFVGTTEVNIPPAIELSRRTSAHFYVNAEQWAVLADKHAFKELLKEHGIGVIPEYDMSNGLTADLIHGIRFPVLVKPADSSGARGITVANDAEELRKSYTYAAGFSKSKKVLVESFLQGMDDTFIRYHFQDGTYSISSSYDRHVNTTMGGFGGIGIAYIHPSKHLQAFVDQYDEKFKAVFRSLDLKDGMITLQSFVDESENFYFYEAGYRLGGSQSYIFTDYLNKSNTLHYMVNYALTGKMADFSIAERDNPFITVPCVNLYIALKPGKIAVFDGVESVRRIPGVLNVTELFGLGETVERTGSLNQVCIRMHVTGESKEAINSTFKRIYDTLDIRDENGNDMVLEEFSFSAL